MLIKRTYALKHIPLDNLQKLEQLLIDLNPVEYDIVAGERDYWIEFLIKPGTLIFLKSYGFLSKHEVNILKKYNIQELKITSYEHKI